MAITINNKVSKAFQIFRCADWLAFFFFGFRRDRKREKYMGHDVVAKSSCHYRRCNRGEMVTNETLRHVQTCSRSWSCYCDWGPVCPMGKSLLSFFSWATTSPLMSGTLLFGEILFNFFFYFFLLRTLYFIVCNWI